MKRIEQTAFYCILFCDENIFILCFILYAADPLLSLPVTTPVTAPGTWGRAGATRQSSGPGLTSSSAPARPSSGWRTSRRGRRGSTGVGWTSR